MVSQLTALLEDEQTLRRLSGLHDAAQLTSLFEASRLRHIDLVQPSIRDDTVRSLIGSIAIGSSSMHVRIELTALGSDGEASLDLPLPERKPFRETKLRIDNAAATDPIDRRLISLIAEAMEVCELVLASPDLSLNQLGKREGRCRTQLGKLFRLSWLSPRIIAAIIDGHQLARIDRRALLEANLPTCWQEQERVMGFAT